MASGGIGTCVPTGAAAGECVPSFPSMAILLQIHLCRNSMRIIGCYEQETVALENTVPKGNLSSIRWWIYYTVVYWVVKPLHLSGILSFKVWRQRVWMRHTMDPTAWNPPIFGATQCMSKTYPWGSWHRTGGSTNMFIGPLLPQIPSLSSFFTNHHSGARSFQKNLN